MFYKRRLEHIIRLLNAFQEGLISRLFSISRQLENQERLLKWILRKEMTSMGQIDDLKANVAVLITNVAKEDDMITSAIIAFQGTTAAIADLQAKLDAAIAAGDPVAIQEASDAIKAQNQLIVDNTAALAAAIPAGTPAAPPA
jgi:hypothetical protein